MSRIQTSFLSRRSSPSALTRWLTRIFLCSGFHRRHRVFHLASIGCAASDKFRDARVVSRGAGIRGGNACPTVFAASFILFRRALGHCDDDCRECCAATDGRTCRRGWIRRCNSWPLAVRITHVFQGYSLRPYPYLLPRKIRLSKVQLTAFSLFLMSPRSPASDIGLSNSRRKMDGSPPSA